MQRFNIAVIWMTGPSAGTLALRTVEASDVEALEFTHPVGSKWSEEDGERFCVVALPHEAS